MKKSNILARIFLHISTRDLGQAHKTCNVVKYDFVVLNPPPQRLKDSKGTIKIKQELIHLEGILLTTGGLNKTYSEIFSFIIPILKIHFEILGKLM